MQQSPTFNNPAKTTSETKKQQKKKTLTAILLVTAIGLVSGVLLCFPDLFVYDQNAGKVTSMYSDKLVSYVFHEPDYDLVVEENEHYMGLDRSLHLKRGGEILSLTEEEIPFWGEALVLFQKYFDAAIHADVQTYNSLFTKAYYKSAEPYSAFAPQMIYGITLEELMKEDVPGGTKYMFNVTYAIYKNNGTFRNDVDSDAYKTLIFILAPENGDLKIDAIDYYRQIN